MKTDKKQTENLTESGNGTKPLLSVVYIVNRIDTGEHELVSLEKVFRNKEDAESHKIKLNEKYKDSTSFKYRFFYFLVEEHIVN